MLHRAQETRELGQMMLRMMGLHEFDCVPFEDFVKPQGPGGLRAGLCLDELDCAVRHHSI